MQFPKLTPLQSRLAACLGTSILLLIIYYSIAPSHFAYAAELDSIHNQDHNHHRIALGHSLDLAKDIDWDENEEFLDEDAFAGTSEYQAEFPGVSRHLIGRAPDGFTTLMNNDPNILNIAPGDTHYYVFENVSVWGPPGQYRNGLPTNLSRADGTVIRRSDDTDWDEDEVPDAHGLLRRQTVPGTTRMVYISANTCLQPSSNTSQSGLAPQLTMYVSLSDSNQKPGPSNSDASAPFVQGFANVTVNATSNVYISIAGPTLPDGFSGQWSYGVAASIDAEYYYYNASTPFIWTVDTDFESALLATYNLTSQDMNVTNATMALRQQWNMTNPPFIMKIYNSSDPVIQGVQNSFCGLSMRNINPITVSYNITMRGMGQNPKQQFFIEGLQPGQKYIAMLGYDGGVNASDSSNLNVVGGGGQLWQPMEFTTKTDTNCKIIYDLDFCDSVAYAVPTNPTNTSLNVSTLKQIYDNFAQNLFLTFSYSLQQIQCHTTESQIYSLATNCDECSKNYKTWLCAVTIPRCEDFSSPHPFLRPRNVGQAFPNGTSLTIGEYGTNATQLTRRLTNSSRNPMIDEVIKPGPYKELLPCQELCFDLVQSCPSALQFQCPSPLGYAGGILSQSYGSFDPSNLNNSELMTCNYLGVDWPALSSGRRVGMTWTGWSAVMGVVFFLLWN